MSFFFFLVLLLGLGFSGRRRSAEVRGAEPVSVKKHSSG